MSRTEAARIAAVLPLPKKRGVKSPKGFTRRYGGTISARIGQVSRDGLDACVYKGAVVAPDRTPPAPKGKPRPLPGQEYESPQPLPPVEEPVLVPDETNLVTEPALNEPAAGRGAGHRTRAGARAGTGAGAGADSLNEPAT